MCLLAVAALVVAAAQPSLRPKPTRRDGILELVVDVSGSTGRRRLARNIGGARLLEYVTGRYRDLDATGHWKR